MSPLPDQEPPTVGHVTPRGAESEVDGAQLAILLQAASSMVDEEFRRAERLDNKARGQITIVGAFFAFVQTITAGALKSLGESESTAPGWLAWTLFAIAAVAAILLLVALLVVGSSFAWRLRKERALNPDDIVDWIRMPRSATRRSGLSSPASSRRSPSSAKP